MPVRLASLLCLAATVLTGCGTHIGADPARLTLRPVFPAAEAWPSLSQRDPAVGEPATIDWIIAAPIPMESGGAIPLEILRKPVFSVKSMTTLGACTARELVLIRTPPHEAEETLIDAGVSLDDRPPRTFNARMTEEPHARFTVLLNGAEVTGIQSPETDLKTLHDPTRYEPVVEGLIRDRAFTLVRPRSGPARGIILHLRSFAGNPFEESVVEDFRRRGWAVLSGNFATSLSSVGRYDLSDGTPIPTLAARIAKGVDQVCAERAYAAEAALAWVAEHHPEVPRHPAAIVGFSAGALGVAPVAARMPGRFDAAVIVCGGADLLSIAQRNPLARIGLSVTMNGSALPRPLLDELCADYLRASSLDPYATAPALTGTPVLMIHGRHDREVPADTGDLLYERLGRPERWTYDGGHAWVFLMLPHLKGDIARWIEQATGDTPKNKRSLSNE